MAVPPMPNPQAVEVLLDVTWRVAEREEARTDELDRKATSLVTFVSVALALTARLGLRAIEPTAAWWTRGLYTAALFSMLAAVALAVLVLMPKARLTLATAYLEGFTKWSQLQKSPESIRGQTMSALITAIARERSVNDSKSVRVRSSFGLLLLAVLLLVVQASILGTQR